MTEAALLAWFNLPLWHTGYIENYLQPWERACSLEVFNINYVATHTTSLEVTSDFRDRDCMRLLQPDFFSIQQLHLYFPH